MTAVRSRRRRSTWLGLLAAIVALAAAGVLTLAGVDTLADSTAGRDATATVTADPIRRLPFTPTALVGTLDDDGRLTSVAVMALEPSGVGGSIVSIAATARADGGSDSVPVPLAERLASDGPEAFLLDVESLTGLSFDVVELIDERRLAQLIGPLGDLPVDLPTTLVDVSAEEHWPAGDQVLSTAAATRAVTATDPTIADWYLEPARSEIWAAIAARVGAGIGTAVAVSPDVDVPAPTTLDGFLDRLFASTVGHRRVGFQPVDATIEEASADGTGDRGAGVVHDRAEMLMVMSSIAPARIGAPLAAATFRIEADFADEDLDGFNNADVTKVAIDRLLFVQVNIVSVADRLDGPVPDATKILIADATMTEAVHDRYPDIFGELEVTVAEPNELIDGVDIVVTLGRSFLDTLPEDFTAADSVNEESELASSDQ